MSIPVHPEKRTSPPIVDAYFLASSSFAIASSSVLPRMGVNVAKNLIEEGSRPCCAASFRIFSTLGRRTLGSCAETKMASAWVAANDEPALQHCQPKWTFRVSGSLTVKSLLETRTVFAVVKGRRYAGLRG